MERAFIVGLINLLISLSIFGQRAYLIDINRTSLQVLGTNSETLSTDFLPEELKTISRLVIAKKYSYWVSNDTTYLSDNKNKLLYKKLPGEASIYIRDDHNPLRSKENTLYQAAQGDFVGNINGQFCREYIISDNKKHFRSYKCAVTIPYANIFKLPYSPPGFPIQQDIVVTKNGNKTPVRMTFDIEKTIIPNDMAIQTKILENQIHGLSNTDRCPEDTKAFDAMDKKLLRQITKAISAYDVNLQPYPNMLHDIPVLNGNIEKLEIKNGETLVKTILYNDKSHPSHIITHTGSTNDTLLLDYPLNHEDKIASFPASLTKEDNDKDYVYYDSAISSLKGKKDGKQYKIQVDETLKFKTLNTTDISSGLTSKLEYRYNNNQLASIYNLDTKENDAVLDYYQNGLLRSWQSSEMTFDGLKGRVCYSYTIGETKPGLWESQVRVNWPFKETSVTVLRFDPNYNLVYASNRKLSDRVKVDEWQYTITYSDAPSNK